MVQNFLQSSFGVNKKQLALIIITALGVLLAVPIITYAYFASALSTKETVMNRNNTGVVLLDRDNKPFYTFYQAKNTTSLPLDKISDHLEHAVIASEDKDFYTHPGFSVKSMVRSLVWDIQEGSVKYGGSTLTQQLVKNSLLSSKRNFLRKYQELILAQELERRYKKEEILGMYLNSAYFGEGAFGAEGAAKRYFDKTAQELTPGESAYLASLLSPIKSPPASRILSISKT